MAEAEIVLKTGFTAIDVGDSAAEHVSRALETPMALGRHLATSLDREAGRYRAVVPVGTTIERAREYRDGGLAGYVSSLVAATAIVWDALQTAPDTFLFSEEVLAAPDSETFMPASTTRIIDGQAHNVLDVGDVSVGAVLGVLQFSDAGFSLNAVVARLGSRLPARTAEDTPTKTLLVAASDRIALLIVRAYDGEGFVVWTPT